MSFEIMLRKEGSNRDSIPRSKSAACTEKAPLSWSSIAFNMYRDGLKKATTQLAKSVN